MKILQWFVLVLATLLLLATTYSRNIHWQTPLTLWQDAVRTKPGSARVHNNLGNSYAIVGRTSEAIEEYRLALQLDRFYVEAYYNLGMNLEDIGRPREALSYYQVYCSKAPWGFRKSIACERAASISQASDVPR